MESHCIPFTQVPHTSALFSDYLYRFDRVARFYRHDPFAAGSFQAAAQEVSLSSETRAAVADVLAEQNRQFGGDARCQENIQRLRRADTLAVVTGQQVGLFGGPAYSVYKALTAVQLAEKLTKEGLPAVPVFWLASEDHDFAEVNHCLLLDSQHQLLRLQDNSSHLEQAPVGEIAFDQSVRALCQQALALWPGEAAAEGRKLLEGYAEGQSYTQAFAQLFNQLFAGRGLVLLDPRHPRLHQLARPIYARAVAEAIELRTLLQQRSREIEQAGYHAQVHLRDNATLLFLTVNGQRQPLQRRRNGFFLPGQGEQLADGLQAELERAPERFSPNALLRPVVQDSLLPTVAYVAGPGEIAYYAQASALYDRLLGRMPAIVPRLSFTLVERKVQRLLQKYKLSFPDLLENSEARLHTRLAERHLPPRLQRRLITTEAKMEKLLSEVAGQVSQLDSTLAGAVETSRRKMLYQFGKIRRKAGRAQAERTEIIERHLGMLVHSLYPQRGLQERQLNFLSFAARYGVGLVERLREQGSVPCRDHQVIFL